MDSMSTLDTRGSRDSRDSRDTMNRKHSTRSSMECRRHGTRSLGLIGHGAGVKGRCRVQGGARTAKDALTTVAMNCDFVFLHIRDVLEVPIEISKILQTQVL